jgi:hypothetical protein
MPEAPPPLAIGCKATRCGKEVPAGERRHAFSMPFEIGVLPGFAGACEGCQEGGLVDWERCHVQDPGDIEALVESLRLELLRDNYWGLELPDHILRKARKRTPEQLETSIAGNLRSGLRLGNPREGFQTPWAINPGATIIDCARHATGTCCRRCAEKWHGIPRDRELTPAELAYLSLLAGTYTERRLESAGPVGARA